MLASQTICLDVDDTICLASPDKVYADREPIPGALEAVKLLKKNNYFVVYCTARYMSLYEGDQQKAIARAVPELRAWLEKWGFPYDGVFGGKPAAMCYVDDKGMHHSEWDSTLKSLLPQV